MGKITVVDIVLRLLGAVIVGFAVGAQRARTSHPAGIRTHILVALGSCVVMVTSCILYEQTIAVFGTTPSDPARLGAQVINGVGFLGAGTILVTGRREVKGLTTAAGLWTSAIIGLTFGGGFYEGGILATVFIMLAELVFSRIEYRVLENVPEINLYMEYEGKHCLDDVLQLYRSCNIKVLNIQITRSAENGEHNACAIFSLRLPRSCGVEKLLTLVGKREGIVSVEEL